MKERNPRQEPQPKPQSAREFISKVLNRFGLPAEISPDQSESEPEERDEDR